MKKILTAIALTAVIAVPMLVSAQGATLQNSCKISRVISGGSLSCPGVGTDCPYDSTTYKCGQCCTLNTIYVITDWIFFILLIVAGIMILIAAFIFVTSSGSPDRATAARNMILYAVIGIIVALLAKAVPAFVQSLIL